MEAKIVLITGASRGIGFELAKEYKSLGWQVIGAVRNPDKATELQALSPYKIIQLDTTDEQSIESARKEIQSIPIDLLINNAGIAHFHGLHDTTKADMMEQFEVNVAGPFLVTREFLPNLKEAAAKRGGAKVIHVSSRLGSTAREATHAYGYSSSKMALNMIQKSMSIDLKKDKITTLSLHPGHVATEINGYSGPVNVTDSAKGMVHIIEGLKDTDSGKFLGYDGEELAW